MIPEGRVTIYIFLEYHSSFFPFPLFFFFFFGFRWESWQASGMGGLISVIGRDTCLVIYVRYTEHLTSHDTQIKPFYVMSETDRRHGVYNTGDGDVLLYGFFLLNL